MKNAWKLFEFNGAPVYLKYWFLILFLITTPVIVVTIFLSVLVHELSHSWMAHRLGYKTDHIFIDVLYGGALIDSSYTKNNRHSVMVSIAGPLSNFALSALAFILAIPFLWINEYMIFGFLSNVVVVNFILGLFNLIPIYPLDGGRISKALFGMNFKNQKKAKVFNGYLSLVASFLLLSISAFYHEFLIAIFSLIFIYTSYMEIKDDTTKLDI